MEEQRRDSRQAGRRASTAPALPGPEKSWRQRAHLPPQTAALCHIWLQVDVSDVKSHLRLVTADLTSAATLDAASSRPAGGAPPVVQLAAGQLLAAAMVRQPRGERKLDWLNAVSRLG